MAAPTGGNLGDIIKALFVGPGGSMMTPDELANQRLLLSKRMGTTDTSPVGHWSAGAARMVDALGDVFQQRRLDGVSRDLMGQDAAAQGILGQIASGLVPGGGAAAPTGVTAPQATPAATVPQQVAPHLQASSTPAANQAVSSSPVASAIVTPSASSTSTPAASMGVIEYTNNSAKRNLPLQDGLASNIEKAVSAVYGDGYKVQVYSGGQGEGSRGRVGSTRHDDGHAGDVYVVGPDGKRVTGDRLAPLAQYWTANKLGGVGLEMRGGGIHLDSHTDRAPTWNYANQGGNYTPAQHAAIAAGLKGVQPALASAAASSAVAQASAIPAAAPQTAPTSAPNSIPQLMAIANNQRLPDGTRKIAMSLLNNQVSAQQKAALAAAEQQQAMAQRQAGLSAMGGNAAIAADPTLYESWARNQFSPQPNSVREYEYGLRNPGFAQQQQTAAKDPAQVQKIQRLTENLMATGTATTPQEAAQIATAIADGRYRESRHPTTGEVVIIDMATGQPVGRAGQQQTPQQQPQVAPEVSPQPQVPGVPRFIGADQSFGVEGALRGGANTIADAAGLPVPFPQQQQTQANFKVLSEGLLGDLDKSYGGKTPSWLLQELRKLTPSAGSALEGSGAAQAKMNSLRSQFESEAATAQQQLANRSLTPATRQDLETRMLGLNSAVRRIDEAMAGFGGQQGAAPSVKSKAEFDRLPKGARFTAPDGSVRIKP